MLPFCVGKTEKLDYASSHLCKRNIGRKGETNQIGNLLGNETGWRDWGGDDASLSIPLNIVSTLKNHVNGFSYSKNEGNEGRKKLKWTTNRSK